MDRLGAALWFARDQLDLCLAPDHARGVPLKLVQEWMGHATISMTMRYAHLAEGIGDDMIQRLAPRPGGLRAVVTDRQQHTDSTWFEPKTKTAR